MADFEQRKNGDELHKLPQYNSTQNIFYPVWTPPSIPGGEFWGANGNCTWYSWGRYLEVFNHRLVGCHGNAHDWWYETSEPKSQTAKVGAVAVFTDNGKYGHVAFIEHIDADGNIFVSHSAYGETSGGFFFRYDNIKVIYGWGYKFLGYIDPKKDIGTDPDPEPEPEPEPEPVLDDDIIPLYMLDIIKGGFSGLR